MEQILMKLKKEEKEIIERASGSLGLGTSTYIRMLALTDSRRVLSNLHKQEISA